MLGNSQFRAGLQPQQQAPLLLPASPQQGVTSTLSEPPTLQVRGSAGGSTSASAAREQAASLPTSAGLQAVVETLPPRPAHVLHQWPRELQRAHTMLRCSNCEHELCLCPDKAWVTWLLDGIHNGVSIGSVAPLKSRNLSSAHAHPDVVDTELVKEIVAGQIIGPFEEPPFHILHTSRIGVIPKKNGKWRGIPHLSVTVSVTTSTKINSPSTIPLMTTLWPCSPNMVKTQRSDLKAAFQLIPVQATDWVHTWGSAGKNSFTWTHAF